MLSFFLERTGWAARTVIVVTSLAIVGLVVGIGFVLLISAMLTPPGR